METVDYKGQQYKLVFSGKTRYGHRSMLECMDGSRQFWIPSNKLEENLGTLWEARLRAALKKSTR